MGRRLIIRGGLLVGLVSLLVPLTFGADAQAQSVGIIGEPFAYSKSYQSARFVPAGDYPYSVNGSNWPQRIHGAGCASGVTTPLKALYSYPGPDLDGWATDAGDNFGLLRACGGMGSQRLWTDAGTDQLAPWAGDHRGAWINPNQFGGWGLRGGSLVTNSTTYKLPTTCPSDSTASMTGAKIINGMQEDNPVPMHSYVEPVWTSQCLDTTNWLYSLMGESAGRNHYTNAQLDSWVAEQGTSLAGVLLNGGTSLLRNEFTVTADDMARIRAAEARDDDYGLFIDIISDDFYIAYLNNAPKAAAVNTVDRQRHKIDSSSLIEDGTNVLAIQVNDKFRKSPTIRDISAGAAYQLVLYDDLSAAQPQSEFEPSVSFGTARGIVDGENFTAEFAVLNSGSVSGRVNQERILFDDVNDNGAYDHGVDTIRVNRPVVLTPTIDAGGTHRPDSISGVARVADYPSGRVCATLRLNQAVGHGIPNPPSAVHCIAFSKVPKLHVLNGDLTVGGSTIQASAQCAVDSSKAIIEGTYDAFGESRAEYGLIGIGPVYNFGSNNTSYRYAPGLVGTFANTPATGLFKGPGVVNNCLNSPFEYFRDATNITPTNRPAAWTYNAATNLYTVRSVTVSPGQRLIYNFGSANVHIAENIVTPDNYSGIDQLAQFAVLTNGRIFINEDVTRIDGVYASNESIHTCSSGPGHISVISLNHCHKQLRVNGAIYAGPESGVITWRTFGSESDSRDAAAEVFNLSPATVMVENISGESREIETVRVEELPPRF